MSTWEIDWEELMQGFNRIYGTEYQDIKVFLIEESKKLGIQVFAEKLGVSPISVNRIKRKLKITRRYLGGKYKKEKVLELVAAGKTKDMTILEIAEHAGYLALNTLYNMAKEEGFEFKRRWKQKKAA